jgi:hypothetical protein
MLTDEVRAMLKYLRIAATGMSLTACVLMIALWVRSYRNRDLAMARHPDWGLTSAVSLQGKIS